MLVPCNEQDSPSACRRPRQRDTRPAKCVTHPNEARQVLVCEQDAYLTAVFQFALIFCRASSRVILFEHTRRFNFPSTLSFGFGDGPSSGHRFFGSVGLPPSSNGMK